MSEKRSMTIDEIKAKTLRVQSRDEKVILDLISSKSHIGMWVKTPGSPDTNCIGFYADPRSSYFMVYPEKKQHGSLPFAISTFGIQIPHPYKPSINLSFEQFHDMISLLSRIDLEAVRQAFPLDKEDSHVSSD